ncbi:hypothetical protein LCGC14_3040330 [marine sediment metagenome]|uniref:Uncharacterized protein n=1 Tax=marine sediment metagenome TaxID=412755 RepID=A0A0F8WQB1_9ZZZZ
MVCDLLLAAATLLVAAFWYHVILIIWSKQMEWTTLDILTAIGFGMSFVLIGPKHLIAVPRFLRMLGIVGVTTGGLTLLITVLLNYV